MFLQFRQLVESQFEAALRTLEECVNNCPDESWDAPVCNYPFCRAAFHGLFWTDLYLGPNLDAVRDQDFHREHAIEFSGYGELNKDQPEKLYTRDFVVKYMVHVRQKAKSVFESATEQSLLAPSGFD